MPKPRRVALMLELEWPYKRHAGIFAGTQQYAQEHGWESTIDEFADDTLAKRSKSDAPYDGVIARATMQLADHADRLNVPAVNVWISSPVRDVLPGVFADFAATGRLRAEHLLARGFRNFAALTCRGARAQELALGTFRSVLRAEGYRCPTAKVPLSKSTLKQWRNTEQVIADWMRDWQPPIGVYVGADDNARIVAQMCRERGWRVPEDVAIIAGWNEETICEHPRPSLTSVELGHERIGYEAARLLDRLMGQQAKPRKRSKRETAPPRIVLPPYGVVVRESTDFFAVDEPLVAAALEFIAAQSHKPIHPADVARAVRLEPRTLQRRFRKFLDRPIAAEIRRVRIERAKRELAQSDRSIAEIARDVGFGEPARMYEVFCRDVGVKPTEYRKQRQLRAEQ